MAGDTTQRFLQSTGAAVVSQLWRVLVTLGVMIISRHLVPRDEYGLWNWVVPAFLVLGAVRDLGLIYHVVRMESRPYGNLLRLELVWGTVMAVATWMLAPVVVEALMRAPIESTVPVIRAMVIFLFLEGLSSVPRVYFENELAVGETVRPEVVRNLVMASVTVTLVIGGAGIWGLVAGQLVASALYAALLWRRAWGRMPLTYLPGQNLALVRISLPLASIWSIIVLTRSVGPMIVAWRFDLLAVASFGLAFKNACRLSEIAVPALVRSLYPALVAFASGAAANARRLFETYALATVIMMALEVPSALFLFVNAELAVRLIAGTDYIDSAPQLLRILAFAPLIDPFGRLGGELLKARHRERAWLVAMIATLGAFTVGGVILTGTIGLEGMAWANLLAVGGLIMAAALYAIDPGGFRRLVGQLAFVYVVPVPLFAGAYLLGGDNLWLRLALSIVAGAVSVAICGARFGPTFLSYIKVAKAEAAAAVDARAVESSTEVAS